MAAPNRKRPSKKQSIDRAWSGAHWTVEFGELRRGVGNPGKVKPLFLAVGEKLPFEALATVRNRLKRQGVPTSGVYMAHDSMGAARYVGRGRIFARLTAHQKAHNHELAYFSFFVVAEKQHEREIETLLIRGAGPMLEFNERKKRVGIAPGNIRDYEPGTYYFERHAKKGRRAAKKKPNA